MEEFFPVFPVSSFGCGVLFTLLKGCSKGDEQGYPLPGACSSCLTPSSGSSWLVTDTFVANWHPEPFPVLISLEVSCPKGCHVFYTFFGRDFYNPTVIFHSKVLPSIP